MLFKIFVCQSPNLKLNWSRSQKISIRFSTWLAVKICISHVNIFQYILIFDLKSTTNFLTQQNKNIFLTNSTIVLIGGRIFIKYWIKRRLWAVKRTYLFHRIHSIYRIKNSGKNHLLLLNCRAPLLCQLIHRI